MGYIKHNCSHSKANKSARPPPKNKKHVDVRRRDGNVVVGCGGVRFQRLASAAAAADTSLEDGPFASSRRG